MTGLVCGLALWFRPGTESPLVAGLTETPTDSLIRHGDTRALLTLPGGEQVALGADEEENRAAIRAHKPKATPAVLAMNDLTIPRGGEFKIELEDGTQVWLNAESTLHYPDTFATDERRVRIEGEAYFKVARDERKPFYVETSGQLIRVYGTEFNVFAYPDEEAVRTTLIEGSISLRPADGTEAELILTPGHQAVFDKDSEVTSVRPVDTEAVTGWRRGVFVFDEQNLEQIMRTLSRWYDFEFRFEDDRLRSLEFMGSMPRYGAFSEVLDMSVDEAKEFYLEFTYGPTAIVGTTAESYTDGYAAFANFRTYSMSSREASYASTGDRAKAVSLVGDYSSASSSFDSVINNHPDSIEKDIADPANFWGVVGGHKRVGGDDTSEVNTTPENVWAGLVNKDYTSAYEGKDWQTALLEIAATQKGILSEALTADWWNAILGTAEQPLLIVNKAEAAYGYLARASASVSTSSYQEISVRGRRRKHLRFRSFGRRFRQQDRHRVLSQQKRTVRERGRSGHRPVREPRELRYGRPRQSRDRRRHDRLLCA